MKHHAQKGPKILKLCLRVSYNSGIILSKMLTYYSQNYAGIIGAGLPVFAGPVTYINGHDFGKIIYRKQNNIISRLVF